MREPADHVPATTPPDAADGRALERGATEAVDRAGLVARRLAHDLASLLDGTMRSVRLAARALAGAEPGPRVADAAVRLEAAETALAEIADLVSGLMESRPAHEVFATDRRVADEVRTVIAALGPTWESRDVVLDVHVDEVVADRPAGVLATILRNLLVNAAAVADTRVRLDVDASLGGGAVRVRVRDDGPGPGAEVVTGRLGLGLAHCRALLHARGGSLELAPDPDGPGALATAIVPPAAPEEVAP